MPSYVVTGASRGIGLEFVRQLSADKRNLIFAVVRNPAGSTDLTKLAQGSSNVQVVRADITDASSLKAAAQEVSKATGGALDVLINNAAFISGDVVVTSLVDFYKDGEEAALASDLSSTFNTNVVGVALTVNAFLPLLRKGALKKIFSLSSGIGDLTFVAQAEFAANPAYCVSKAALNMLSLSYANALRPEGFTVVALSPGLVNTATKPPSAEDLKVFSGMVSQFQKADPSFTGVPLTPEQSVSTMLESVIGKFGPEKTGAFVSHKGNDRWL